MAVWAAPSNTRKAVSLSRHTLQLAEKYFAAGEYYTAAFLYGQYLHPAVRAKSYGDFPLYNKKGRGAAGQKALSRADVLYRQAESYRLSNYWTEASQSYKESYAQDPAAHPAALYWYAVCQRSLNQYDAAYESLVQFLASTPQDAILRSAAEKEFAGTTVPSVMVISSSAFTAGVGRIETASVTGPEAH